MLYNIYGNYFNLGILNFKLLINTNYECININKSFG